MLRGTALSGLAAGFASATDITLGSRAASIPDFTQSPPLNLTFYTNASLWEQWRPKAHFIHPSNGVGDPTAFWMDDSGTLHLSALYSFLRGIENSIYFTQSIAGSTTKDLLHFKDHNTYKNPVSIGAGNEIDFLADFDGSVIPHGYNGLPTLIWTAVKGLPITWSKDYHDGYECQALAYSEDNGDHWIKPEEGANIPVIAAPPYTGNVVTGFRDPWVVQGKQFDDLLSPNGTWNHTEAPWYISVSGGIHGDGPRLFFYRQSEPNNFTSWDYLGPILQENVNSTFVQPGSGWAGSDESDGSNYETSQLTSLGHEGDDEDGLALITMGAESGRKDHKYHWSLYRAGHWARSEYNESVVLNTNFEGVVDWGLGYACTGVQNRTDLRRYTLCVIGEDQTNDLMYQTEYSGALTLPRELFVKDIDNVVDSSLVRLKASWAVKTGHLKTAIPTAYDGRVGAKPDGTVDLTTLGIRPAQELAAFRTDAEKYFVGNSTAVVFTPSRNESGDEIIAKNGERQIYRALEQSPDSRHFELETTISFPNASLRNEEEYGSFSAGISIFRSVAGVEPGSDGFEDVSVVYRPANESIMIQRNTAIRNTTVNHDPEVGKLRLWERRANGTTQLDDVKMRVFLDGSTLEVYVNDVMAISTRAYYWFPDSTRVGYVYNVPEGFAASDADAAVAFRETSWWQGLVDAYPERPKNKWELIRQLMGYPEPENNPNNDTIIYQGVGDPPAFPVLP
ncbi:glycosyl hydrolase [Pestalotiopsis sp. NC0098]|nr:glycosyl hydrolase [Pestalotiopsis sp. NC0098]